MNVSLERSLEEIEKDNWGHPPPGSTGLVMRIHELRKKPLKDFTVEDLRVVIGQNFSLELLVPIAIEKLKDNILAEGDLYEGDLLQNVLNTDINYWKNHYHQWTSVKKLFEANKGLFDEKKNRQILKSFKKFEEIHHD
jgi:hypothetical protein